MTKVLSQSMHVCCNWTHYIFIVILIFEYRYVTSPPVYNKVGGTFQRKLNSYPEGMLAPWANGGPNISQSDDTSLAFSGKYFHIRNTPLHFPGHLFLWKPSVLQGSRVESRVLRSGQRIKSNILPRGNLLSYCWATGCLLSASEHLIHQQSSYMHCGIWTIPNIMHIDNVAFSTYYLKFVWDSHLVF